MVNYISILDFGSQYTQLIARRIRELGVYAEIIPFNKLPELEDENLKGVILSGSPFSVTAENALHPDLEAIINKKPILGICYGAQYLTNHFGGIVANSDKREYGQAQLNIEQESSLLAGITEDSPIWMSHADSIVTPASVFEIIASTNSIPVAAFQGKEGQFEKPILGVQFHPEVTHSIQGKDILKNFVIDICQAKQEWSSESFIQKTVGELKERIGDKQVIIGLSGGVDSSVAAVLLQKAIGKRLHCIFINNGLLRANEFESVIDSYQNMDLNLIPVDASEAFLSELAGVKDPEKKRKIIGRVFIEVFERESKKLKDVSFLAQGTIYPDVIESISVVGPSVTIKSHHNVGGLPDILNLEIVEPLRMLFKDEVRRVGTTLGIKKELIGRHPFPGPGLAIRILGEITAERVALLQKADKVFIDHLKSSGYYDKVWQAGAILLPIKSVGVMGDERTYENTCALRCVGSVDGMTAKWSELPYDLLGEISNDIINKVKGINRVVYDISTKPPATIEWE